MSNNRVAVVGAGGWVARLVVKELVAAGVPVRVLSRPGSSDLSEVPDGVETVPVDWKDVGSVVKALEGIDILVSLVGHHGREDQHLLIPAIKAAGVKLFAPADLAMIYTEEEDRLIDMARISKSIRNACHEAGIPTVRLLSGNMAEFALDTPMVGVDIPKHRVLITGQSDKYQLLLCTSQYIAAGYAAIFSNATPSQLAGRTIGFNELAVTGDDVIRVMTKLKGVPPVVAHTTIDEMSHRIAAGHSQSLAYAVRQKWGNGTHTVGPEVYEVPNYSKKTLDDLLLDKQLRPYRSMPIDKTKVLDEFF